MRITSTDIAKFQYCPYGMINNLTLPVEYRKLNLFQLSVIKSILAAEKSCLIKDTPLNLRKILRKWDSIWWEDAAKNEIPIDKIQDLSVTASKIFNDYLKYEVTDFLYPTIAVNLIKEKEINKHTLIGKADLLKVNLSEKKKNFTIVSFGNKKISAEELFLNPYVWSTIYSMFFNREENIRFVYFGLLENKDKFYSTSIYFRKEEIANLEKYIKYIISGIEKKIDFMNYTKCEECKQCHLK